MRVAIHVIPHAQQRYPTIGDWVWLADDELVIFVSDLGDWRKEMLVAVHELVEVLLCKDRGISQAVVDAFDIAFEKRRAQGLVAGEPGDAEDAPYRDEHCFATGIERLVAAAMKLSWLRYEDAIDALG